MPSNRCFCLGWCLLLPSIVLVILSWVFDNKIPEESDIDGEIGLFYQVGTCRNVNRSFQFTSASGESQVWDAYTMLAVTPETPIGSACPLALEEPLTTVSITLEPEDGEGYGAGLPYSPVVMLPTGSYGMLAFDIVDLNGNKVLDITNLWLGPDDAYPWTVDGTNLSQAPDLFAGVGRRLLDGEVQPPGRKLLFAGLQSPRWTDDMADQAEEEEVSMATTHAPTGRRLLKGGTSSGTSSAGRSGSTGSSRWGGSSGSVTTSTYGSRTTSTRVAVYSSATGRTYGGSPGPYYYRGYFFFYGVGPRYSYSRAPRVLTGGAAFFVVRHDGYGCYTCPIRTCYACGSCTTRASCGAARTEILPADLDRYEIDIEPALVLPAELPRWPLQLRLYNLTQYVQRTPSTSSSGSSNAFLTFYTDQTFEIPIGAIFAFIGWPCLVVGILILCIWRPTNQAKHNGTLQTRPQTVEMTNFGADGLAEMHDPPTGQAYNSQPMPAAQAYMMIVIPQGVAPGQSVDVQAPDGRRVRILVPAGMSPGMQLQVAIPAAQTPTYGQAQPVYGAAAAQPVYGAAAAQPVYGAAVAQPVYGTAVAQPVAMPAAYPASNNPHIAMFGAPYPSNPPSPPDGANRGKND